MDKIDKALRKLSKSQKQQLLVAYARILAGDTTGLDFKKLKGYRGVYRLRIGRQRLVFQWDGKTDGTILQVSRRDDQTYRDF